MGKILEGNNKFLECLNYLDKRYSYQILHNFISSNIKCPHLGLCKYRFFFA